MTFFGVSIVETKKNFWFGLVKGVACAKVEIKDQVSLTLKFASNYFASLK